MKFEVQSTANFVTHLLHVYCKSISNYQLIKFKGKILDIIITQWEMFWYPGRPNKGAGLRTIRKRI